MLFRSLAPDGLVLPIPETVVSGLRDTSSEGPPPSQLLADLFLELTARGQRLVPLFRTIYGARVPDKLPEGVTAKVDKNNLILSGMDKQVLGAAAAKLRSFRAPEPYKGKGVKYAEETIIRKAGKAAGKGK